MSSAKGKKAKPGKPANKPSSSSSKKDKDAAKAQAKKAGKAKAEAQAAVVAHEEATTEATETEALEASGPEQPQTEAAVASSTADVEGASSDDDAPIAAPVTATTAVADMPRADQKRLLESLVFVSDRAINAVQLGRMLKIKSAYAKELVEELIVDYQGRGIELVELSGGYQFRSAPTSAHVVREHIAQPPVRLTRAQLETLALVAYRQPITRPEIDDVRGVDSGSALRVLLERGLLKMLGRKDEPGRPLLYGTTPFFLDFFGMRSLKDLPTLREFTELSDENRALFKRKTGETIEEAEAALLAAEEAALRDSLAPRSEAEEGEQGEGEGVLAGALSDEPLAEPRAADEVAAEPSDRDLEVEAETFAAGSLQTSPDSVPADHGEADEQDDDEEDDFEDEDDDEEDDDQELPQAPEA